MEIPLEAKSSERTKAFPRNLRILSVYCLKKIQKYCICTIIFRRILDKNTFLLYRMTETCSVFTFVCLGCDM